MIPLAGKTNAVLFPIEKGVHVDMSSGSVHFSAGENDVVEIHADDAIVRPAAPQATQAAVTILVPNLLQIAAGGGTLNFSYLEESRNLPAGYTYRIYLDGGTQKTAGGSKVGYFVVGAATGAGVWGIQELIKSKGADISQANRRAWQRAVKMAALPVIKEGCIAKSAMENRTSFGSE